MDAWLVREYVWELPLDMMLTICPRFNLNNTLPQLVFFYLGVRRAGLYHGLRMPVLRFMVWSLFFFVLVFQIILPSRYSCGEIIFSLFHFRQAVNLYEPGFIEMFSSVNGLMAFAISSPYLLICGILSFLCLFFDYKVKSSTVRMKKAASWFWFLSPVLLMLPIYHLIGKLVMVLALRTYHDV